jgi:superfamily II DNA or RNA helicase
MQLRPYQQQLITDIRLQYQLGHKSVLAVLPTGGGKTVCFSYIAQQASIKGNRVCVLVHRAELLDQASRSMPVPHGRISAGKSMDLSHTVQVASVQTLARRLHLLPRDFFQLAGRRRGAPHQRRHMGKGDPALPRCQAAGRNGNTDPQSMAAA